MVFPSPLLLVLASVTATVALVDGTGSTPRTPASADLARAPVAQQRHAPKGVDATIVRAPDGLFYADALVDGHPVHFIVDTGATATVLSPADAARIGALPDHSVAADSMDTAAGAAEMQWGRPSEIRIAGHVVPAVQTALPSAPIRASLLGQDVLSRLDSLTLEGDRLTLR